MDTKDESPIGNVLAHFEGVMKTDAGWEGICPAHPDHGASLSIKVRDDGTVQIACGCPDCTVSDILEAAGLVIGDLLPTTDGDGAPDLPTADEAFMDRETARALLPAISKPVDELLLEWAEGVVKMTPAKRAKERSEKIAVLTGLYVDPVGMVDAALAEVERGNGRAQPPIRGISSSQGEASAGPFPLTELGLAERLAARHKGRIYAIRGADELRGYDPQRGIYSTDHGLLVRYATDVVRSMYREAGDALTDEAKDLRKHAKNSESKKAVDGMFYFAKSLEALEAESADFDADAELLNTTAGVVNLRTGELHPHDPKYRMTKIAGCAYAPDAPTPMWDAYLQRFFEGNTELIAFVQRLFGYALTGYIGEQIFAIFYGAGNNGKSTLVDSWQAAMGDYAGTAAIKTFLPHSTEAVRTDLATLCGKRLVSTSESKAGQVVDAATIKVLTSRHVTCRFNYARGEFTYTPQYLVILDTNFKPQVTCEDFAIKRRVLLVPFSYVIPEDERDKKFTEKLIDAELPGILAWGVAGAVDYLAGGLRIPETVRVATDAYRAEMDALHEFWSQWLIFGEPGKWTTAKALRDALETWAGENGVDAKTLPHGSEWGRQLRERGARRDTKKVNGKAAAVWYGVRIVGEEAQEAMM